MADDLDFVVHAFEGAVTNPELDPDQNAIEMSAEHSRQFLEWLEATVAGAPEPLQEMPARPRGVAVGPEAPEILLEEVRLHDGAVEAEQGRQPGALVRGEVVRILEPQEARVFELYLLGPVQLAPRLAAHLIDGSAEMLAEVEAIENERGLRQVSLDGVDVNAPTLVQIRIRRRMSHLTYGGVDAGKLRHATRRRLTREGILQHVQPTPHTVSA